MNSQTTNQKTDFKKMSQKVSIPNSLDSSGLLLFSLKL